MRNELYDPDVLINTEDSTINNDNSAKKKNSSKNDSLSVRIKSFLISNHINTIIGISIFLFGVYLLIAFISYFSNGATDQSIVNNVTSVDVALDEQKSVANVNGAFGASVAEAFITNGIGLSSFVFVIWLLLVGIKITGSKLISIKINFFSITLVSCILIALLSLILGLVTIDNNQFLLYGGCYGKYTSLFLIKWVGYPGTAIIYLILSIGLFLAWYKTIVTTYQKAKSIIPLHKIRNNTPGLEETDIDDADTSTVVNKNAPFVNKENHIESIDLSDEEDTTIEDNVLSPIIDSKQQSKELVEVKTNSNNENKLENDTISIVAANKIEVASTIHTIEDPTKELSHYQFPPIDLLKKFESKGTNIDIEEQEENKKRIIETLNNYGIPIKKIEVCVGPTVTLFEIIPADGVRISKIKNLEDDIALSLSALGIRIIAPIPGRGTIGIEVPNRDPQIVSMRSIIESKKFQENKMELPMAIGCTISNEVFIAELAKMPHILVAGATGQGKSVGLNAIITSLLYSKHPSELKFVLIDPKMVEFSLYSKLEHHYLAKLPGEEEPIITDPNKVIATLNSLTVEMDNRYQLLKDARVKNLKEYNAKYLKHVLNPEKGHKFLPYIVVVVDEFCDLIMMAGKEVEMPIARIAQKARAVGIHMIIATQRPSTNVITGIIKANFPGRIAFRVTQMVDSRTILDCSGAQQLIGRGDMLFSEGGNMKRIQCAFVDTPEIESIVDYIDHQPGFEEAYELPEFVPEESSTQGYGSITDRDPLFEEAATFIIGGTTASTSSLQRRYSIGYNRAGKIMDQMEAAGIVGPSQGGKPRQVLMDTIQLTQILAQ